MSGENQANCPRMQTRGHHTWLCLLSLIVLACCASTARAQGGPPLLTDDPGTPGPGHWEINLAATMERGRAGRTFELPLLDITYGVGERIQLKFEAPWVPATGAGRRDSTRPRRRAGGPQMAFL